MFYFFLLKKCFNSIRALDIISTEAKERYLKDGRQLIFKPDYSVPAGPSWLKSPIKYKFGVNSLEVECPFGFSPTSGVPERFAGMNYLKLPSFASMVEYVMIDAFLEREALLYVQA